MADARALADAGEYSLALEQIGRAADLHPDKAMVDDLLRMVENEQAASVADRQVAVLLRHGRTALQQGRYRDAADSFDRAYTLRPDEANATEIRRIQTTFHRKKVFAALDRDDKQAAVEHLEALLQLEPDETAEKILRRLRAELGEAGAPPRPAPDEHND